MPIKKFDPNQVRPGAPKPYPTPTPGTEGLFATLKQWNKFEGFGFVSLEDGRRAFLHKSVLRLAVAYHNGGEWAWNYDYRVEVEVGKRGLQVTKILTTIPRSEASK